jgi:hypothetical protein
VPKAHGLGRVPVDHHLKIESVAALVEPELPTAMLLVGIQVVTIAYQGDVARILTADADGIRIDPELVRDRIAQLEGLRSRHPDVLVGARGVCALELRRAPRIGYQFRLSEPDAPPDRAVEMVRAAVVRDRPAGFVEAIVREGMIGEDELRIRACAGGFDRSAREAVCPTDGRRQNEEQRQPEDGN